MVFHPLDVKEPASIASMAKFVETNYKKLDILVSSGIDLMPIALHLAVQK